MPELPDVVVYIERLKSRLAGKVLARVRLGSPFVLRTAVPPLPEAHGRRLLDVRRMGKRIVFALEGEYFLVVHLMIAGRLHWKEEGARVPAKVGLAALDFEGAGTVMFTEASGKKRASLHLVQGEAALAQFDRGGLEVLEADEASFSARLRSENHTLKRSLTDPRLFSGIGNAYSDEILHAARLSPMKQVKQLSDADVHALYEATQSVLRLWLERTRGEVGEGFPEKVTAFRKEMAVHGRYREPCPVCGSPVQRIVYAANEANYCATCQVEGRLLADRSLSRLLKDDWPKSLEELEERRSTAPPRADAGSAPVKKPAARRKPVKRDGAS